jgi:plastocyanin
MKKSSSASALTVVASAAALVAGCGGGSGSGGGGAYGGGSSVPAATTPAAKAPAAAPSSSASGTLAVGADESSGLAFTPKALTAKAGAVTLKLTNGGGNAMPHAIAIEGQGVAQSGSVAQPGATSSISVKLKPGTYTFYCPVGDHRAEGMEGKLTVS